MIYYKPETLSWFDSLPDKPEIVNADVEASDIAGRVVIDDLEVAFLLQRANNQNNIVCYRLTPRPDMRAIKAMYYYLYVLATEYKIDYVCIRGRYKFAKQFNTVKTRDNNSFYIDLQNSIPKLKELLKDYI